MIKEMHVGECGEHLGKKKLYRYRYKWVTTGPP